MAPAAPSVAGAMMSRGEGVAAFHLLLLSLFPEVSVSFRWDQGKAKRLYDEGPVVFWLGREIRWP